MSESDKNENVDVELIESFESSVLWPSTAPQFEYTPGGDQPTLDVMLKALESLPSVGPQPSHIVAHPGLVNEIQELIQTSELSHLNVVANETIKPNQFVVLNSNGKLVPATHATPLGVTFSPNKNGQPVLQIRTHYNWFIERLLRCNLMEQWRYFVQLPVELRPDQLRQRVTRHLELECRIGWTNKSMYHHEMLQSELGELGWKIQDELFDKDKGYIQRFRVATKPLENNNAIDRHFFTIESRKRYELDQLLELGPTQFWSVRSHDDTGIDMVKWTIDNGRVYSSSTREDWQNHRLIGYRLYGTECVSKTIKHLHKTPLYGFDHTEKQRVERDSGIIGICLQHEVDDLKTIRVMHYELVVGEVAKLTRQHQRFIRSEIEAFVNKAISDSVTKPEMRALIVGLKFELELRLS